MERPVDSGMKGGDPPAEPVRDGDPGQDRDADHDRDVPLGRSVILDALSLGFSPPTNMTLRWLRAAEVVPALAAAAALVDAGTGVALARRVRDLSPFFTTGAAIAPLSRSYTRLFGHTARGAVSAYETEYGDDTLFQKPQELSDIAGFLRAFGLVLDPSTRERIDHVACELEFMAFLARKEAHAAEVGDASMRAETRRASGLFLKDHLGRVAPAFSQRVLEKDPDGFYGALAALCLAFVESDCARFGVPVGSCTLRLRTPIEDGAPIACGAGHCPGSSPEEERP